MEVQFKIYFVLRDRRREEGKWGERKKDRDRENLTSSGLKGL